MKKKKITISFAIYLYKPYSINRFLNEINLDLKSRIKEADGYML